MGRLVCSVAVVVAVLAGALVVVAQPSGATSAHLPVGGFDSLTVKFDLGTLTNPNGSSYTLKGWAADQDTPGQSVAVHIYVNGSPVFPTATGKPRPDVQSGRPWAGPSTGWEAKLTYNQVDTRGTVCAYAIDQPGGGGAMPLGCKDLAPPNRDDPVGSVDRATVTPGTIRFQGWAGDPDGYRTTRLRIYKDDYSEPILETIADLPRADVKAAFPRLSATTGFDVTMPVEPGTHIICIVAGNTGPGGYHHAQFLCWTGVVPGARPPGPHDPQGELEEVHTDAPGHWMAKGWAYDPDTGGPVAVRVRTLAIGISQQSPYLRSYKRKLVSLTTGLARSDVEVDEPAAGPNAGFDGFVVGTSPLPPGVKVACAYAVNVGPGAGRFLGCIRRA